MLLTQADHWILERKATGQAGSLLSSSSYSGHFSAGVTFWLRFWFSKNYCIVSKPLLYRFNSQLTHSATVIRRGMGCLGFFRKLEGLHRKRFEEYSAACPVAYWREIRSHSCLACSGRPQMMVISSCSSFHSCSVLCKGCNL